MAQLAEPQSFERVLAGEETAFPNADSAGHTATASAADDYVCRFHPPDMLDRLVVEG